MMINTKQLLRIAATINEIITIIIVGCVFIHCFK
jgi:hypothetical protein